MFSLFAGIWSASAIIFLQLRMKRNDAIEKCEFRENQDAR